MRFLFVLDRVENPASANALMGFGPASIGWPAPTNGL